MRYTFFFLNVCYCLVKNVQINNDTVVSFLSLPVFWKILCVSGKSKLSQRYNKIVTVFFFFNIESDLHMCLTNPLNKNPFCENQASCS